ncbi:hypothetical protein [Mitsuokella sp.]|uniref:hypothetical protein n=1 Tax=Mitsuokella TaxID=52225 RepID=UPI0029E15C5D|nr:hypothetical protein [Mitsuokella sp.]MDD6383222.1 hypothetical protein [Selenomonadaceae bacterium]MDY4475301.1 hypothetical protein [Mitsuokella sp.]
MLNCSICGREISEKEALINRDESGRKRIVCRKCFEEAVGTDYDTFRYRRENAKQTLLAVLFCLAATIYAFIARGPLYGLLGIILTILVYFFATRKPKKQHGSAGEKDHI